MIVKDLQTVLCTDINLFFFAADRQAIQKSVQSCMFVEEEQFHSKDEESDDSLT